MAGNLTDFTGAVSTNEEMESERINTEDIHEPINMDAGKIAYETQLFGFSPKSFCNGIYNTLNQYLVDGLEAMKEYLLSHYDDAMSSEEMTESVAKIQLTIIENIDRHFDKFEGYVLSNIMTVPPNIVLPDDQLQLEFSKDCENITSEIKELEQNVVSVKLANALLEQEMEKADKTCESINLLLKKLTDYLEMSLSGRDEKDIIKHCTEDMMKFVKIAQDLKI